MNKRADIPVTILVIGVIGVCVLAILSFSFSLGKPSDALVGLYLIRDVLAVSEQISFYENSGISFESLMNKELSDAGSQLYIRKNSDGTYSVREEFRNPGELVFSVEYSFSP